MRAKPPCSRPVNTVVEIVRTDDWRTANVKRPETVVELPEDDSAAPDTPPSDDGR